MAQCPECETFSVDPLLPAWAATYQHTATCTYDPESFGDELDDDGFRYDPVEGESRIMERGWAYDETR